VSYTIGGRPYTEATVFKQSVTRNKRDGSSRTTSRIIFKTPDGDLFRLRNWKQRLAEPGALA